MRALNRKLLRDIVHSRGPVVAVAAVVACGIASFVTMRTAYESLLATQQSYYAQSRFAHIFAGVERAPRSLLPRIAALPGVDQVEDRVVVDVTADVPGLEEPATLRLVSIPETDRPTLNDVVLRSGRYIESGRPDEILISEPFAQANRLNPGDRVGAVINGRLRQLSIVGIALSPEYVMEIRPGDLFPDARRFGIAWMGRDALGSAFDLRGGFNDLALTLRGGARSEDVVAAVDEILDNWGGTGAYDREQQISHRFLSDEINQNRVSSTLIPSIFLGVAAFLVHLVLSRLVRTQREQIAVLKAFGYGNGSIGLHYVLFAAAPITLGAVIGLLGGMRLARGLAELYATFFRFPLLEMRASSAVIAGTVAISAIAAIIGALSSARGAVRLEPAVAMRPEAPPTFRAGFLERIGLLQLFPPAWRIAIRNLGRNRWKTIMAVIGVALAVSILVVGRYSMDAIEVLMDVQFRIISREDVTVPFVLPRSDEAVRRLQEMPGVMAAEPFRTVPVRIISGHREKRLAIIGMPPDATLHRLIDAELRSVSIAPSGLTLNSKLASMLGVEAGDHVRIEILEGRRRQYVIPVNRLVNEYLGTSAYMDLRALNDLMRESSVVSGAYLQVDPIHRSRLYAELKATPAVAGVSIREAMLQGFRDTIAQNMQISNVMIIGFACVIAFGVVYNGVRIALSERARELASLRVLGFTRGEATGILLGEQAAITLMAIPIGCALGALFCVMIVDAFDTELFRFPLVFRASTFAFSIGVVLVASIVSGLLVARRVRELDLVEVLKTRE